MSGLTNNALTGLGAGSKTIIDCLDNGTPYLSVFTMTRIEPDNLEGSSRIPLDNLTKMVDLARIAYKVEGRRGVMGSN